MNGMRTNQFDAPTSFMTSISRRRAKVASRIVFTIRNSDDASSTTDDRDEDAAGSSVGDVDEALRSAPAAVVHLVDAGLRSGTRSATVVGELGLGRRDPERRRERVGGRCSRRASGWSAEDALELLVRVFLGRGSGTILTSRSSRRARCRPSSICCRSRSTFMKISSSTPSFHWLGAVVDARCDSSRMPPNSDERHRDGDDAGERHQQVAAQRDQRLAREVREARPHRCVSSRRRRRRAPGRGRAMPWSSSITRRRIASTMRWSWVAMHDRRAGAVDAVEQPHDADRRGRVEVSGRLVGEQDQRPVHERACDRHPLLLTAGELGREVVGLLGQADEIEDLRHLRAHDVARAADHLERERDVLVDRLVGQQLEVLEDAADVAAQLRDLPAAEPRDVAAGDDDAARRSACSSRSSRRRNVDFPEPDGPTRKTNSPFCDLERRRRAGRRRRPCRPW